MAIITSFLRTDRFFEIDGCPLRQPDSISRAACGRCRFNIAAFGEDRVGCITNTGFRAYEHALGRLAAASEADCRALLDILERERSAEPGSALAEQDVRELLRVTAAWLERLSGEGDESKVARTVHDFARAALELREPVRILS